jgi:hypothetical protein
MAKNIESTSADKAKSILNGARQAIPGVDDVKDSADTLRSDVGKLREDVNALAGTIRDSATGTVKQGTDYVQSRIGDVKQAGVDVMDKVKGMKDMPVRKAVVAIVALCAISFIFGRKSS